MDCFEFSLGVCLMELFLLAYFWGVSSGRQAPPKVCYFRQFCHIPGVGVEHFRVDEKHVFCILPMQKQHIYVACTCS
jgi:hypothetical protein